MIVMKFGGTSVEDAKSMRTVIEIVRKEGLKLLSLCSLPFQVQPIYF